MNIDRITEQQVIASPKVVAGPKAGTGEKEIFVEDKASLDSSGKDSSIKGDEAAQNLAKMGRTAQGGQAKALKESPALQEGDGKPAAGNAQLAQQLEGYLAQIMTDPQAEAELIQMIAGLNATGQLGPVLQEVAAVAAESGSLPPMPEEKRVEMVNQLAGMIDAELRAHGMTPETHGQVYQSWEKMGQEHVALVQNSMIPPRGPGEPSAFTEPAFIKEMELLQGAPFIPGNKITPLIDGPASFAERDRMIDNATRSIHMMTWAFYDDETGWDTAKKLAKKHGEGLDVQVVVDGQVGSRVPHMETLKFMEEQGIPVVRWRDPKQPYHGQHRKVMIVDGKEAIAGGLNAGNVYSHKGPADGPKWRDTDILIEGPAVAECEKLFASVCGREENPPVPAAVGSCRTAVVNHTPGKDSNIMLSNMKAIQGASETIDIENAYFIQTPGMRQVMMDALERGVKVRLLTNSAESIDEKIITSPILQSLPELIDKGAEVYLKKGDTLHSKFMVVDGMYYSVGSYNLHPRSERYEGEMNPGNIDPPVAGILTNAFERDIEKATRIKSSDQITVPQDPLTMIATRYFFDQL